MYVNKPLHINALSALYISANKQFSVTISTLFALIDAHLYMYKCKIQILNIFKLIFLQ